MTEQVSKDSLSSWPERIYLQRDWDCVDEGCAPHEETTWCAEKIHDVDVEYVRADIVAELRAERDRLQNILDTLELGS